MTGSSRLIKNLPEPDRFHHRCEKVEDQGSDGHGTNFPMTGKESDGY
jgi:hypothetical protein